MMSEQSNMLVRSCLVRALYRNLLGPADGNREVIEQPFLKYELGILNSVAMNADSGVQPTMDSEIHSNPADIAAEAQSISLPAINAQRARLSPIGEQDSDDFGQEVDTDLRFKIGTVSLGLHFVLTGDLPWFKICVTWARYVRDNELGESLNMFRRHPNFFVTEQIGADIGAMSVDLQHGTNGSVVTRQGARLHVSTRKIKGSNRWVVRVFLENRTKYSESLKEEDRIFQPQIRVVSDGELLELDSEHGQESGGRYESEDLLYRKFRAKARGHMCAAVWRDVDPESQDRDGEIGSMSWPDSQSVPRAVCDEFIGPLVRTEYLPLYAVLQPIQSRSEFAASEMSNAWDPEEVERNLSPIERGFSEWIGHQKKNLDSVNSKNLRKIGEENLRNCDKTCLRIRAGIDFLKNNEKARAAFCFMNATMNDKRLNEEGENLRWREFQMAFILQCLMGVSGESKEEREVADVLWFPTGGGKTEAYLGLVIFAIAYRRLTPGGKRSNDGGVSVLSRYTLRLLTMQQFQRALGAIVAADVRRVENWLPEGALGGDKISDRYMRERLDARSLWGTHRFSLGMWIGSDSTPNDFAYRTIKNGKVLLNCEGALLPQWDDTVRRSDGKKVEPAQILTCPVCSNTLCLPENQSTNEPKRMTWVVKSPKSEDELRDIPKEHFEDLRVTVKGTPDVEPLGFAPDGMRFYRLTMEIAPLRKSRPLDRKSVDKWWKDMVCPKLDHRSGRDPLESTSPSMPGYFFLKMPGAGAPHDFAIFCTNRECKLNRTEWFETIEGLHDALVPNAFQTGKGRSKSVPISAYTIDEQIYLKCPSFLIATVDKFANLPFVQKCSSIFGNVDVVHPHYGYGRKGGFESPRRLRRAKRDQVKPEELRRTKGFNPPSLILQDELHLIEGPLGSMVGAYEMAVDVLSDNGIKPKYIASSATIKESGSQVGTIFRRGISTFPPPGIDSSDSYFSKVDEDIGCKDDRPGRLYLGMATTKSTVTLPIKAQSIVMSEIFKMRSNPDKYGLALGKKDILTDPYWTFVSYFTDLQLLSKFTNYYLENITDNVNKWSAEKSYNPGLRGPNAGIGAGLRLFALRIEQDMQVHGISVYCANDKGMVKVALYRDGDPVGHLEHGFEYQRCVSGEIAFILPPESLLGIKSGERVWVAVINDSDSTVFQTVAPKERSWEVRTQDAVVPDVFPDECVGAIPYEMDAIRISLNSPPRQLDLDRNVVMSSATQSDELARNLDRLKRASEIDSLQTSPVFGTGIDIDRLGVMEVMNQPKTNSGYIQATGRVGRGMPGLVINWLRAGRARDLNHYENFIGYHMSLHRFVEPVTASPFSHRSINRCLGPIMVSILRNARSIQDIPVDPSWAGPEGHYRMSTGHDSAEVRAVGKALGTIAASRFIAEFRQMRPEEFKKLFEESKAAWRRLASDMESNQAVSFKYEERNPSRPPSSNVVLGSPNHKYQQLECAYDNTPISLRQTEPAATFGKAGEIVQIRPSQFITRYGPGALISGKNSTWVVPTVWDTVRCLQGREGFEDDVSIGLENYRISDLRMKRILHRLHPDIPWKKLNLFELPSNHSLPIGDLEELYKCPDLSAWAICYDSRHPSMVLAKTDHDGKRLVVKCPECQRVSASDDPNSTNFYTVRYVLACKKGHLGDIDWRYEVHRDTAKCKGNVFEWKVSGGNDNVMISCMGHWKGDKFVPSECGGVVSHIQLKYRSKNGMMSCSARFAETGDDPKGCREENGQSLAKMVSKSQMSLRMPIVVTTMEIQKYKGVLFEHYAWIAEAIRGYAGGRPGFSKDNFVQFLKDRQAENAEGYTSNLIRLTEDASEDDFSETIHEIMKITTGKSREYSLKEQESLAEELSSLEKQTHDRGTGPKIAPNDPRPDIRFPIIFSVMGLSFEAMPFGDIRVTQVQTGYTREITPPSAHDSQADQSEVVRVGEPVRHFSRFADRNKNTWYIANQLAGEGIFIRLNPKEHKDCADVFGNDSKSVRRWKSIHEDTKQKNKLACMILERKENSEQKIDALEMETVSTNPLFVWWHSFVHELINQLAIDSGFMGASLGERVYCVDKGGGKSDAGVLIYAASPGTDGTLGGLISLVDKEVLPKIIKKTLHKIRGCSNDPLCTHREINDKRRTGAACHACLMNSETSCAYQNKFLDRNIVSEALSY